jgi:hypothetical protein
MSTTCIFDLRDWSGKNDGFLLLFDQRFLEEIAHSFSISINLSLPGIKTPTAIDEKKIT